MPPPLDRAEIDAHDAVFRINYAPLEGYERYVGSRTTFDVINAVHSRVGLPLMAALPAACPPACRCCCWQCIYQNQPSWDEVHLV